MQHRVIYVSERGTGKAHAYPQWARRGNDWQMYKRGDQWVRFGGKDEGEAKMKAWAFIDRSTERNVVQRPTFSTNAALTVERIRKADNRSQGNRKE